MPKVPTNALMESFKRYCEAIRKTKPNFTRFKDGGLIKNALKHLSEFQTEMLFIWFLKEKKHMQPTVGAALSKGIISDFINAGNREYGFYNNLEQLARRYAPLRSDEEIKSETGEMMIAMEKFKKELSQKFKPFGFKAHAELAEEASAEERKK